MSSQSRLSPLELLRKSVSQAVALLVILFALTMVPRTLGSPLGEGLEFCGYFLLVLAAVGRIWCSIYISGRKNRELCVEGPYSLCRNPLYFFSFLGVAGFGFALQSGLLALGCSSLFLAFYAFVIRKEEVRLSQIFGADFEKYVANTPRFFPHFKGYSRVESLVIEPRVVERSLSEVVWFLFAIIAIDLIEAIHESGNMVLGYLYF
ncbi:methyltransferase family protein [Puniceicoccus vermicola]|uniref:Isoprenylcysteine carboxylmethyltransferase family protein n=1 Tax=Puniceicoccus vermicola TaxID=388746 RepID=A0A7X1E5F0_9BACT|nr:isoprenylcysteine carboxylmethyltransferase family protein [Puniceicoccus vermicola]MBC2601537.1 isoprenylcysteine carboxylmethyltransferase family protein [Puniceicoccus vermicola]